MRIKNTWSCFYAYDGASALLVIFIMFFGFALLSDFGAEVYFQLMGQFYHCYPRIVYATLSYDMSASLFPDQSYRVIVISFGQSAFSHFFDYQLVSFLNFKPLFLCFLHDPILFYHYRVFVFQNTNYFHFQRRKQWKYGDCKEHMKNFDSIYNFCELLLKSFRNFYLPRCRISGINKEFVFFKRINIYCIQWKELFIESGLAFKVRFDFMLYPFQTHHHRN